MCVCGTHSVSLVVGNRVQHCVWGGHTVSLVVENRVQHSVCVGHTVCHWWWGIEFNIVCVCGTQCVTGGGE